MFFIQPTHFLRQFFFFFFFFFFLYTTVTTLFWLLITGANHLLVVSFEDNPLLLQSMLSTFVFEIIGRWKWGITPSNKFVAQCYYQILLRFFIPLLAVYSSWSKWALRRPLHPSPWIKGEFSYNSEASLLITVGRVVLWIWSELSF